MDQQLTPEEIVAYNEAFAKSLAAMNNVLHEQEVQMLQIAITAAETLVRLCQENSKPAKELLDAEVQKALDSIKNINPPTAAAVVPAPLNVAATPDNQDWYTALLHALSLAQENAVNAQNNAYIVSQSVVVQSVMTLLSVIPVYLGYTTVENSGNKPN